MKPQELVIEASALTREDEQAEVIRRLEEDIIFGRFAPGSRLVEDTLMTRYRASRHFVRQGLFQLERQGIVLREKNIGATVRFYSAEEVRQIYEVREMLTRQAALMIALPASQGLIEELSELQRQYCARACFSSNARASCCARRISAPPCGSIRPSRCARSTRCGRC